VTAAYVNLVHLGCARNLIDSEVLLGRLAEEGLVVSGDPERCDYVVVNTCSFIGPARDESYAAIDAQLERKRRGDVRGVVVVGCLVQRFQHKLERELPEVDLFAELSDYRALAGSVRALAEGKSFERYLAGPGVRAPEREGARLLATPGSYSYLRISHGCDHVCSFCAIPGIRGKHRSKPLEAVLDEARELTDMGARELVLVAEDSTWWGRDIDSSLPDLVEALADLESAPRVRVMYAYPNAFPWRLTELLREHPGVLPYLDIPVQHISTPVLRAMKRSGSGDQVRATLDRLREEVPGITLRSTLLVGFPGETEEHVEELCGFVREYQLGRLGAFTFSREEGTTSYDIEPRVPEGAANRRLQAVLAVRDEVLEASQAGLVGDVVEVLVDEVHDVPEVGGVVVGRTDKDAPEADPLVVVEGCEAPIGALVPVRVTGVDEEFNLVGRPETGGERG
jgi:ribosomal protein S12 methylthiotransferase